MQVFEKTPALASSSAIPRIRMWSIHDLVYQTRIRICSVDSCRQECEKPVRKPSGITLSEVSKVERQQQNQPALDTAG